MLNLTNIKEIKKKLLDTNPEVFVAGGNGFPSFLNSIKINSFRHIADLEINFLHPVTVITGSNKIGKTSILLLIACSHEDFYKYDSTKPDTDLRKHKWVDVISFTPHETTTKTYQYEMSWRVGTQTNRGNAKRLPTSKSWGGLGKSSNDPGRINAKIRNKHVRLIDLERLLPLRTFSNSMLRKIANSTQTRLNNDIEKAFEYILDIPNSVEIHKIGSHINKVAYLIKTGPEPYSSYNAATGEESLINMLVDIFESPAKSLILIDEIEAGFHPKIQRKLADVIQVIAWKDKKQFIVTTHSPSFLASLPQKSRVFIELRNTRLNAISNISVNAAFSKMDSKAYPLIQLYCEDDVAEFIIMNVLLDINKVHEHFDRLVNIIKSGAINEVKRDYERHKRNFPQMRLRLGYCCVFDGDHKDHPDFSSYHNNPNEFTFFLFPYIAPEKFLVNAFLALNPNNALRTALNTADHHTLFSEMVSLGLAADNSDARAKCWICFEKTPEYRNLKINFMRFIIQTVSHFSKLSD